MVAYRETKSFPAIRVPILPRGEKDYADRVLLWVDERGTALFFLQVQGSGRVKLPDGKRWCALVMPIRMAIPISRLDAS